MSELEKSVSLKKPLCKKNIFLWVIPLLLSVATVAVGAILRGKSFLWVSALITVYSLAPFFISFEMRKPKAKELVTLAVLCALAAASRAAFIWFPNFKPMAGVIFITALALGPTSGFLCGALSVLASNFIFGQGPWTPFQMLSFGLGGLFFGVLSRWGVIPQKRLSMRARIIVSAVGFLYIVFIGGPILDIFSVVYGLSTFSWESIAAIFLAGFPVSCMQGTATFVTIFLFCNPLLDKLARLRTKYGMFQ